jgi:hypothetical protein
MTLQEEIYTAIGEASMCWEQPEKAGIFNEKQANVVAEKLLKHVQAEKLKFAIEHLYKFKESTFGKGVDVIKKLEQQLKELEDGK